MADLAKSAVVIRDSWWEGGAPLTKKTKVLKCTVTTASMGTTTNKLLATAFGLTEIRETTPWQKDDNTIGTMAIPSYDGSMVLLYDLSNATDATRDAPVDLTGVFRCIIKGT